MDLGWGVYVCMWSDLQVDLAHHCNIVGFTEYKNLLHMVKGLK